MDLDDLADLVGPPGPALAEATSILVAPEPLVLRLPPGTAPGDDRTVESAARRLRELPTVTVLVGDPASAPGLLAEAADVALTPVPDPPRPWVSAPVDSIAPAVAAQPRAALGLVALLRGEGRSVWDAVAAEAATYGMLLGGQGFRRWLLRRGPAEVRPSTGPPVVVERSGDRLAVTLDRPEVRNAVDSSLRDHLVEALSLAAADPTIGTVELRGSGPSFSAGGDLAEFGSVDGATAFAVRLTRHPGLAVHAVADRTVAHLHGHCIGAGIEVPAFARRVVSRPDAVFRLPEVAMGLVPGAGGTVSIPRRIGRQRTAWLALSGAPLDAGTARSWGLVDVVEAT